MAERPSAGRGPSARGGRWAVPAGPGSPSGSTSDDPATAPGPRITCDDQPLHRVLVVSGAVRAADTADLRARLVDAAGEDSGEGGGDVLLDARRLTSFDDLATAALVAGRSRAESRRRRLVVVDDEDGPTARSLRRTGQVHRTAVYPDTASAVRGIAGDRAAVADSVLSGRRSR